MPGHSAEGRSWGGLPLVVDTSAWARAGRAEVARAVDGPQGAVGARSDAEAVVAGRVGIGETYVAPVRVTFDLFEDTKRGARSRPRAASDEVPTALERLCAALAGDWVKGNNAIAWRESDQGSGLRFSRLKVDGSNLSDGTIDYQANGGCRTARSDANGEFARDFTPCTQGPYLRYYPLRTEWFSDGQHEIAICVQDDRRTQHKQRA